MVKEGRENLKKAEGYLAQGSTLREQASHAAALSFLNAAIALFVTGKDYSGLISALGSRCLTWKHLLQLTGDRAYAVLAKKDAEACLELTRMKGVKAHLHTSHFRVAEILIYFKDYSGAIKHYELALRHYRGTRAEKGDFRYHLGEALFRNGQENLGKATILKGLKEIQDNRREVGSFLSHVWESGALMRLTELLWPSERQLARDYLARARQIISRDQRLVMRKKQLRLLTQRILK